MQVTQKYISDLAYEVIGCAIEVHKIIGPGLLESVYERCFTRELSLRHLNFQSQRSVPLNYKGSVIQADLRYDVLVENLIIVELKSIEAILPIHVAVLLTYMRMLEKPKGIIINFNSVNIMKSVLKSVVNHIFAELPGK